MGSNAMSRVQYSFDNSVAALAAKPEARTIRAPARPSLPSRRYMRGAMETFGLFAFGFGATTLLIHFAVGFLYAMRLSGTFPPIAL